MQFTGSVRCIVTVLVTAAYLSGCANQGTLEALDAARAECAAGDEVACDDAAAYAEQAEAEKQKNTETAVGVVVLGVLLVGVAALAASGDFDDCDHDHHGRHRHCGCDHH